MASSSTYDYSNLQINGTTPTAVYANGTRIYRLIANGVDYIHKTTTSTQTITINFSYQVDAEYDHTGGCSPSDDVRFSNAKLLYSVNRGDMSAGLYVKQIEYSGYYTLGDNSGRETIIQLLNNADESGNIGLKVYNGWQSDGTKTFVPHFTLTVTFSDNTTANVTVPNVSITPSGSSITTALTTFTKTFTKTVQEY